jgi:3-dehydroquinate synthase
LHELVPEVPLRHGHAISIDMAYSATLANIRGLLSKEDHQRILSLFSRAGLSMDHHQFDEEILDKGTKAILRTRDGLLRAAVPSPLGKCVFLNDVSMEDMYAALRTHKEIMKSYPRNGEGIDAFVDSSDTGYTVNGKPVETNGFSNGETNGHKPLANGHSVNDAGTNGYTNGYTNGHANGHTNGHVNGHSKTPNGVHKAVINAAQEEEPQFPVGNAMKSQMNGHSVHANGTTNGHE